MGVFARTVLRSLNFPVSESSDRQVDSNRINFNSNNVFQRYLSIDVRGPEIETPTFCRRDIQGTLVNNDYLRTSGREEDIVEAYIIPLYVSMEYQKRTSEAMIRAMFETSTYLKLCKVTSNNGVVYYGGSGMIFNSNMDCLFLSTIKYDISDGIKLMKSIVYVNPKVFIDNGPIEKNIIKKTIPLLFQEKPLIDAQNGKVRNVFNYPNKNGGYTKVAPEIIVADITDRFISKPDMPKLSVFNDDEINNYMSANYDVITKHMAL